MKYKLTSVETTIFSLLIVLLFSCQKNDVINSNDQVNQLPKANAGNDIFIFLPIDSVLLMGTAISQNGVEKVEWRKISGPNANIISPAFLLTNVTQLQQGDYQFELTVFDKKALSAKDTVQVTVISDNYNNNNKDIDTVTGPGFIIFKNLEWQPIWYYNLEIPNVNSYALNLKKVFVQRGMDSTWTEVKHYLVSSDTDKYDYFFETRPHGAGMYTFGSLYINYYGYYNNIPTDSPSVKIEF